MPINHTYPNMEPLPLHHCKVHKFQAFIHKTHTLVHSIALISIIYYRLIPSIALPNTLTWLLTFLSETFLSFLCRRFGVKSVCPAAFFRDKGIGGGDDDNDAEFIGEREEIKRKYEKFKERLKVIGEELELESDGTVANCQNHPPLIEIIGEEEQGFDATNNGCEVGIPVVVYVSREKRPSYPHHFKAGALNALLRVSGMISNSGYILVLDCDMYSNDPSSARQAMCFHLDPTLSSSLAFVQFPQKFHNLSNTSDIYTSALANIFEVKWRGMDGLRGPILSGTCFYIKREALYGLNILQKDMDITKLKDTFGPSNQFISSLAKSKDNYNHNADWDNTIMLEETKFVASCGYEKDTQWGQDIGFMYNSVVEDYSTGFMLHCRGWSSVFCNPTRAAFLGSTTTNLNDTLVQGTRWNCGLLECFLSPFCPLIHGLLSRMPLLQCFCYAYLASQPLYCLPAWCLALVPQLCLLNSLPIYPKVSSPWFIIYAFVFISPITKYLWDVVIIGGTIQTWWNEWRMWMIKSITCYTYGTLDAILKLLGIKKASFVPTSKVVGDQEQLNRYQNGIFDFQASCMFLVPLVTLTILNMLSLIWGIGKFFVVGGFDEFFGQVFLSFFILLVNYPIIEGMMFRKDKGKISLGVTLHSVALVFVLVALSCI